MPKGDRFQLRQGQLKTIARLFTLCNQRFFGAAGVVSRDTSPLYLLFFGGMGGGAGGGERCTCSVACTQAAERRAAYSLLTPNLSTVLTGQPSTSFPLYRLLIGE